MSIPHNSILCNSVNNIIWYVQFLKLLSYCNAFLYASGIWIIQYNFFCYGLINSSFGVIPNAFVPGPPYRYYLAVVQRRVPNQYLFHRLLCCWKCSQIHSFISVPSISSDSSYNSVNIMLFVPTKTENIICEYNNFHIIYLPHSFISLKHSLYLP